jgi:hypothetical protein
VYRRQLVKAVIAGSVEAVSGGTRRSDQEATSTFREQDNSTDSLDFPVERTELRHAVPRDYILAIVNLAFGDDWRQVGTESKEGLPDRAPVAGTSRDAMNRAYRLSILKWHEVVNIDSVEQSQ